ncbi:MAG TPA: HAD family phosphatase [Prolixibacteraceae bacterium]|nr:HAD family phosphatase [Prolixibacteraceae bacterium]
MEILQEIRNIIFDLGGVLLNINPKKTIEAFGALGMDQLIGDKGLTYDHEIFYLMEQGKVTPQEFREGVRKLLPQKVSDQQIDSAWTAMLLDFPDIRVKLLQRLSKDFNLYLFSNTNAIHVEKYFDIFRQQHGFEVTSLFKQTFHSNEIGYRKPSVESFEEIIRLAEILPQQSLFIDDSAANIEGAVASGMKGLWLQPGQSVEEIFQQYL